ncbi:MAG: hypothetical protein IKS28_00715 [Clostridia bacterium]|nr:hypothetical protein [Clostridia bacterium]
MDNDFNTALAVANLFGYVNELTKLVNKNMLAEAVDVKNTLKEVYGVLRLLNMDPAETVRGTKEKYLRLNGVTKEEADSRLAEWVEFRNAKDFAGADVVRNAMAEKGIVFATERGGGSYWDVKIGK